MDLQNGKLSITARELVKDYGKRRVVNGVNLSLAAGEIVGLLGNVDITNLPMYRRSRMGIGYLPQEASVFRKLTVEENVMAVVETLDMPKKERKDYVLKMLDDLDLKRLSSQKAYTLSGGERRRLEITSARNFF